MVRLVLLAQDIFMSLCGAARVIFLGVCDHSSVRVSMLAAARDWVCWPVVFLALFLILGLSWLVEFVRR